MSEQFTRWDSVEYLKTEADMAAYLDACIEEAGDDPAFIARALGTIARARGMTQVAKLNYPFCYLYPSSFKLLLCWLLSLAAALQLEIN
ncbi:MULTISPECIES: addiction module antidote protein [Photorhabdus]|uniref:Addiction module antidote protein n=2 Tax=Photorhabdus asymbiotica TaxID=291112 RepID=C7BGZ9_PHOAA|nr:addiction module antidote protein [Photorhabdus asymbiotica]RKS66181.1 putative addiction module antidote protein [Photorhabdus asymbiotica]CAQ83921.1 conserved hypothetical protein [Photorhabdus asymbiotica]